MSPLFVARFGRGLSTALLLAGVSVLAGCAANQTASYTADRTHTGSIGQGAAAAPAAAPSGPGMSLEAVLAQTMKTNPDIGIARAQSADAQAGVLVAAVPFMPTIDYSAAVGQEQTYAYDSEITTDAHREEASIRASQLVFDFGKTATDVNRAQKLEQSAGHRLAAKATEIAAQTIEAYLAVLELDTQIGIASQNIAAHQEMYRVVSLNQQAGNGTVADEQKAATRLEGAKQALLELQANRRTAASTFERLTGTPPGRLSTPNPPAVVGKVQRTDLPMIMASDPTLLALKRDKESLEAQKQALILDGLPRVTLDGVARVQTNVGGVTPTRSDGRVMLSVNGTLFDGGDRVTKAAQIEARIQETEYRYRRAVDNLEFDVDDAQRVLDTAGSRLSGIQSQITSAEQVVTLYNQQFQAGTRGIFELLDAQQELAASRAQEVTMRFDVLRAKYRLLRLTGQLTKTLGV